jgi:drug/metabolite transporter (DMT)-like permease
MRTHQRVRLPSWAAGMLAATGALMVLGLYSLGFYASGGGLLIAVAFAFAVGTGAAGVVDARQSGRDASVVAFYLLVLVAAYLLVLPALVGTPPGATSGQSVPAARGGPAVEKPR